VLVWASSLRHRMDREGFFDSRLNMPCGHYGFAMCLIRERNELPAALVGDVEAPTFCHASYRSNSPHGSSSRIDSPGRCWRLRVFDLDPSPAENRPDRYQRLRRLADQLLLVQRSGAFFRSVGPRVARLFHVFRGFGLGRPTRVLCNLGHSDFQIRTKASDLGHHLEK
jgi:hypothetical protein